MIARARRANGAYQKLGANTETRVTSHQAYHPVEVVLGFE